MNKLRFGVGGIPHTANKLEDGIKSLNELGLKHMELEFVRSVFVKEQKAPTIKELAEENDVTLTVHGSYYTNFASADKSKWYASINRIAKAAFIGELCGAKSVTYHSGYFQDRDFSEVKPMVVKAMEELFKKASEKGADTIKIAPELTGKRTQIGDIGELIQIIQEVTAVGHPRAALCIDFAHKYARDNGKHNSYDEFMVILDKVATELGEDYLKDLHIHVSGIDYSDKGETNHLVFLPDLASYREAGIQVEGIETHWDSLKENRLQPNKFNWQDLLTALKRSGVGGYVVCESPILELDALLLQQYYHSL